MQQNTVSLATTDAIPMQQSGSKVSKSADFARNTTRNSNATSLKKLCNKPSATGVQRVASISPRRSNASAVIAGPNVWHFLVDGKRVTAIDAERLSESEFLQFLHSKFGSGRIHDLTMFNFNQPEK